MLPAAAAAVAVVQVAEAVAQQHTGVDIAEGLMVVGGVFLVRY